MADTPSHEEGLALANDMFGGMQQLARSIIKALADGRIDTREGISLGMRGLPLVNNIIDLFDSADTTARADLLYVLEHGTWALEE
jgi:hypothetical protein